MKFCTDNGVVKEFMPKIVLANYNNIGTRWANLHSTILACMASKLSAEPERTVGIIIIPLFGARNEIDEPDDVLEQVREDIKDTEKKLVHRVVQIAADESTFACSSHTSTYSAIMICSDMNSANGQLASVFASSFMWTR